MEAGFYSEEYIKWVQQAKLPPLTNTQHRFAEWLLEEERTGVKTDNRKTISQIGDLEKIFISVRRYIKQQKL